MERDAAALLILDGIEKGHLTVTWQRGGKVSYHTIIDKGIKEGFLKEVRLTVVPYTEEALPVPPVEISSLQWIEPKEHT
jgi:hypothetical protein